MNRKLPSVVSKKKDETLSVQLVIRRGTARPQVFEGRVFLRNDGVHDSKLTPRETEVLRLLADGKSNKEVGELLAISVNTAETHRNNIMRKLEFRSLTQLVRFAIRHNLIDA